MTPSLKNVFDLPTISETIAKYGLGAKKSLGQNFILDLNLTSKIARQGLPFDQDELILEIGPGPGALTRGILLNDASKVLAIEKDNRCLDALAELKAASDDRLEILEEDALRVNYEDIQQSNEVKTLKIIANLPYNISTELLMNWVEYRPIISGLVLMFQKEVALRLCATPQTKSYGRLSVLTQLRFSAKIAFDVPPSAFKPAPKVTSSIVVLKPKEMYPEGDLWACIKTITKQAFAQRRKMLRKTMKDILPTIEQDLADLGYPTTARAEEISPQDYVTLAQNVLDLG